MKLFKSEVFIRTVDGLGINQNKTVYVLADNSAKASEKITDKFSDSNVKTVEQVDGHVIE